VGERVRRRQAREGGSEIKRKDLPEHQLAMDIGSGRKAILDGHILGVYPAGAKQGGLKKK
jgi:hypothetical protein